MRTRTILAFILIACSHLGICQVDCIHSYVESDGWCGTYFKAYSDSSFIHTWGCEHMQSMQVGTFDRRGDTIVLKKCALTFENFIDRITFIPGEAGNDTLDLFYFDKYGRPSQSEEDVVATLDSANQWLSASETNSSFPWISGLRSFSRQLESYQRNGSALVKTDPYYHVEKSYKIDSHQEHSLVLNGLYTWTQVKKIIPIPKDTRQLHVYYSLPQEIISILNLYYINLNHSQKNRTLRIDQQIFSIE